MPIVSGRDFTIDDLIVEFMDTMERERRTYCPVVKKLKQMKTDGGTVDDFEAWIFAQPYAVDYIVDVIRTAGTHHPPDLAGNFQTAYAWQLAACNVDTWEPLYPWEKVRQPLEILLHGEVVQGIAPDAMKILIGIIRASHPNAKNFLAHPFILARIPPDVDMTDWPCRDFPAVEKATVKGNRCTDSEAPAEQAWVQLTTDPKQEGDVASVG